MRRVPRQVAPAGPQCGRCPPKETILTIHTTPEADNGFEALGITGALLKATLAAGLTTPKPIQTQAIPHYLAGRDVLGIAQTGSGKTAAFALPILTRIMALGAKRRPKCPHALILAPTRELAVQIDEAIRLLSKGMHITTCQVLGGVSRNNQVRRLRDGVDILIATPGRLVDLVREGDVKLDQTRWLVLDEADRMLDMGFINDVKKLARATHPDRQTTLFSATMPDEIEKLAMGLMKDPIRVSVAPQGTTVMEITQGLVKARTKQKRNVLADILRAEGDGPVIIFARTKHGADKVTRQLEQDGFSADVIHGNKSQNARQRALNGFRDGSVKILVATDIAARGIDVPGISLVVNYDLPDEPETYVHRIGRTGRNGADGKSVTLCDPEEMSKLRAVEKVIRKAIPIVADHTGSPDPFQKPLPAGSRPERPERSSRPQGRPQGKPQGRPARSGQQQRAAGKPAAPHQDGGRGD
ncbi:DEAD/DEAH box helicase, partial [Aquibium carbonis]